MDTILRFLYKLKHRIPALLIAAILLVTGVNCQTVKPYQRSFLNDTNMQMGGMKAAGLEIYAQTIREGSSGAGGKNSGGCGCN